MLKLSIWCALLLIAGTALAQQADNDTGGAEVTAGESAQSGADREEEESPARGNEVREEQTQPNTAAESDGGVKAMSGMSILGNREAPKSLVIVPWKSSELGRGIGVSRALDTRIRPVDRDVFERELRYYELRAGSRE